MGAPGRIGLSRVNLRLAAAGVLIVAILGGDDQQVIGAPGAHSWATYPAGDGAFFYLDYADAASVIASNARADDGIVYQEGGGAGWLMIPAGVQYYLGRDMRSSVPLPRELLAARTAPQTSQIDLAGCAHPAACLGAIPGSGSSSMVTKRAPTTSSRGARPRFCASVTDQSRSSSGMSSA